MPFAAEQVIEMCPDFLRIQKFRRFEQPVAPALDPFERQSRRPGILQDLRDARARQPDLGGKVLAGVELLHRQVGAAVRIQEE